MTRGTHIDPLAWHLTLASLGLCSPPSSSEEKEAATAMAMGGVDSPTATATATAGRQRTEGGGNEEVEGTTVDIMAIVRSEEELGETEAWPHSDPLVDVYTEVRNR